MQMIEATNIAERSLLPLPSAALVIDMREGSDDEVVEWLKIEIADLASEMKTYNVHHWRYLTEFLSFTTIKSRRHDDEQLTPVGEEVEQQGPMGLVHPAKSGTSLFYYEDQTPP